MKRNKEPYQAYSRNSNKTGLSRRKGLTREGGEYSKAKDLFRLVPSVNITFFWPEVPQLSAALNLKEGSGRYFLNRVRYRQIRLYHCVVARPRLEVLTRNPKRRAPTILVSPRVKSIRLSYHLIDYTSYVHLLHSLPEDRQIILQLERRYELCPRTRQNEEEAEQAKKERGKENPTQPSSTFVRILLMTMIAPQRKAFIPSQYTYPSIYCDYSPIMGYSKTVQHTN